MGSTGSKPTAPGASRTSRAHSLRREDKQAGEDWANMVKDPWDPCILTLDGGGIRGYSSLVILQELMREVRKWENHYEQRSKKSVGKGAEQTVGGATGDRDGCRGKLGHDADEGEGEAQHRVNPDPPHGVNTDLPLEVNANLPHTGNADPEPSSAFSTGIAASEEELLPCHYFDYMYGTSTGGLIAIMLGRLRMTVTEALELYRQVGEELFGNRRSRIPLKTKYHHEPLERAVRDLVSGRCSEHDNCDGNDHHPWHPTGTQPIPFDVDQPRVCQSCCLTATQDGNLSEAYLLRSYAHYYKKDTPNWIAKYNEGADAIPIWQVTRATAAAPFYFNMLEAMVNDELKSFKDGGTRENNPSGAALSEFHALYHGRSSEPALMLSVGTGRPNQSRNGFASALPTPFGRLAMVSRLMEKLAVFQSVFIKYTEGETLHKRMRDYARGENTWYKRLNVSKGLEDMPLDQWIKGDWTDAKKGETRSNMAGGTTLTNIEKWTTEYLARAFDPEIDSYARPETMLKQAAQKLVLQRRARARQGGERWETFVGNRLHRRGGEEPPEANGRAG